mmetsp:Transcript_33757/g.73801  ORF Transcript_33757/g.73801 Transcript_33757/m.73801 type:complete len:208 (+) Transcript_33757:67-690(+)
MRPGASSAANSLGESGSKDVVLQDVGGGAGNPPRRMSRPGGAPLLPTVLGHRRMCSPMRPAASGSESTGEAGSEEVVSREVGEGAGTSLLPTSVAASSCLVRWRGSRALVLLLRWQCIRDPAPAPKLAPRLVGVSPEQDTGLFWAKAWSNAVPGAGVRSPSESTGNRWELAGVGFGVVLVMLGIERLILPAREAIAPNFARFCSMAD